MKEGHWRIIETNQMAAIVRSLNFSNLLNFICLRIREKIRYHS